VEVNRPPEHKWERHYSLSKGDIYVEAGAYLCRYGRLASRSVGDEGRVILIEPEPTNISWIKKVVEEQGLTNVTLIEKAVWSEREIMDFVVNEPTPSGSRIARTNPEYYEGRGVKVVKVEVDTVDNILDGLGLDHVDLFVADVENAEVNMVKGMSRWLEAKKIHNISIAAYHRYPDGNYAETSRMLEDKGYRVIEVWGGCVYARR
jgi:FkbM family methyltransferase